MPKSATIPIFGVPLGVLRWKVGQGFDAPWLRICKSGKARTFQASLRPGGAVWDVGYYPLLASRIAEPIVRVLASELLHESFEFLSLHVEENRAEKLPSIPKALDRAGGLAHFAEGQTRSQRRFAEAGEVSVEWFGGDEEIAAERLSASDRIKTNIEGGELEAISEMQAALEKARMVFNATRSPEVCVLVESINGYKSIAVDESVRKTP